MRLWRSRWARVDVLGLGLLGRCGRALARQLQGQLNGERDALALGALHGNSAVHHVHEILRDGHAEPRALDAADGGGALALEGVEDVLDEFGAHANARVRHGEAVAPVADWRAGQLVQRHLDEAAGIRELQALPSKFKRIWLMRSLSQRTSVWRTLSVLMEKYSCRALVSA